jgi:hypothetical protein
MIYKPEYTVDRDAGALTDVRILPGDMPNPEVLTECVCTAEKRAIDGPGIDTLPIETLTADKVYFAAEELPHPIPAGIMPIIPDRTAKRNLPRLTEATIGCFQLPLLTYPAANAYNHETSTDC